MNRENGIAPALARISSPMRARRRSLWARASAPGGVGVDIMARIAAAPDDSMSVAQPARPVALVTGAARRIGAAIARRLHRDFDLALHCRASRDAADALAAELEARRAGSTLVLQADLADATVLPGLVAATIARFGRLDGLVNNASAFFPTPAGTATVAQWDTLFAVNARAPFLLAQAAAPHLARTGGAIVNLADAYALQPRADLSAYAASKAALLGATRALAVALRPD